MAHVKLEVEKGKEEGGEKLEEVHYAPKKISLFTKIGISYFVCPETKLFFPTLSISNDYLRKTIILVPTVNFKNFRRQLL